jgi:hypothetical protein
MADLEFISSISSTFIDEINKFITIFTSTIKSQFEDVESKVKVQELEINKLREELNSKKYEEKNYTSVSVIKNQDKQIHELNNTIKTLESRLKYLEQKANNSKELIKSIIEDKKTIDIVVEHVDIKDTDTDTNTDNTDTNEIIEEKIVEIVSEPIPVKKIAKKSSKKNSVEPVEPVVDSISNITTPPEPIIEKPKRKIAIKKSVKNELPDINEIIEKDKTNTELEKVDAELEKEAERIEKEKADAELEKEAERIEKEKADAELEKEAERIEAERIEAERIEAERIEVEHIEKEKVDAELEKATTSKAKKSDVKKEKETKSSTSVKKEKETKKPIEVKKEEEEKKVVTIEVKYPDTIPHLDTVNILELNNIDYYLDETTNNVFQITPSEEIGAFIGVYDKDSKKIIKMNS